jgi:hypothetical protein
MSSTGAEPEGQLRPAGDARRSVAASNQSDVRQLLDRWLLILDVDGPAVSGNPALGNAEELTRRP